MQKLIEIRSIIAPLKLDNIDTDMIIPKQFLKTIKRTGLGKYLFHEMRYNLEGEINKSFVLNQDKYKKAKILIAGKNFGCGSSREHAPWALADFGIRVIISSSYADIFYNNCFKNSILPIKLDNNTINSIWHKITNNPDLEANINLKKQVISFTDSSEYSFEIEENKKETLLNGLDDIAITLKSEDKISAYENNKLDSEPWLYENFSKDN
jgi:3-isopropylmalate/(R)-2-methylmalate dehydratase small subunit